jgi:hypothetical protein
MPEVRVAGNLPSALARSNYKCVLSLARRGACGAARSDMPEVRVAGNLPSALARSNYKCVLSSARDAHSVCGGGGHSVLAYQPFRGGQINKRHIDLVAVFLAELLKRPVGDKQISQLQLAGRN